MPVYIKPKSNTQAKTAISKTLKMLTKEKKRVKKLQNATNRLIHKGYKIKSIKILDLSKKNIIRTYIIVYIVIIL